MTAEQAVSQLHEWNAYYQMAGGAAATLLGLLFVAVSLNADLILANERPQTRQLAEQAFQNYIAVLVVSLFLIFPRLDLKSIAASLILQASLMFAWVVLRLRKAIGISDASFGTRRVWRRMLPSFAGYSLLIVAGGELLHNWQLSAFRLVGFSVLLLLISATSTSWDLLVRVAEIRHSIARR